MQRPQHHGRTTHSTTAPQQYGTTATKHSIKNSDKEQHQEQQHSTATKNSNDDPQGPAPADSARPRASGGVEV
ncbi:hypothetical protein AAHZ94_15375 [Streptomyces sp. HSW2009]|uniref:hypothetical protein n=1 Tax=Streptomyces sp. HSW2009 TaxID=3142890 RepID=UPI0032EC12A4